MVDTGPATWTNKIEIDRTRWEERFVGELAEGFNPIGQYETKGGQDLATHARLQRHEKQLKANEAKWAKEHKGARVASNPWKDIDGDGIGDNPNTPPSSFGKSPPRQSPSSSPGSKQGSPNTIFFTRYGVATEAQRQQRVEELTKKLGVDKVDLVTESVIDTTAGGGPLGKGHNSTTTVPNAPSTRSTDRTTRRGDCWPVDVNYIHDRKR